MQKTLDERVDAAVEGGREQQLALAAVGVAPKSLVTAGRNPRSAMWSALVEHGDRDRVESHVTLTDQVLQASGRSHPMSAPPRGRPPAWPARRRRRWSSCAVRRPRPAAGAWPESDWPARGSGPESGLGAVLRGCGRRCSRRTAQSGESSHNGQGRRRSSCPTRCGRGRARRDRRGCRAGWRSESGRVGRCRRPAGLRRVRRERRARRRSPQKRLKTRNCFPRCGFTTARFARDQRQVPARCGRWCDAGRRGARPASIVARDWGVDESRPRGWLLE